VTSASDPIPVAARWTPLATLIGGVAGVAALVFGVGGAVMWSRLHGAGVAADEAIGAVPQQTIVAIGTRQLALPVVVAASIFALTYLLERHFLRQRNEPQAPPRPVTERKSRKRIANLARRLGRVLGPTVGRGAQRVGRLLSPLAPPFRWYFAHVPSAAWAAIPAVLVSSDPVGSSLLVLNITASSAVGVWAAEGAASDRPSQWGLRAAIGLAVLSGAWSLVYEWRRPKLLPVAEFVQTSGATTKAPFIALSGGEVYFVHDRLLTVAPADSYKQIRIRKAKDRPEPDGQSALGWVMEQVF
jgi:hypothetical protein